MSSCLDSQICCTWTQILSGFHQVFKPCDGMITLKKIDAESLVKAQKDDGCFVLTRMPSNAPTHPDMMCSELIALNPSAASATSSSVSGNLKASASQLLIPAMTL